MALIREVLWQQSALLKEIKLHPEILWLQPDHLDEQVHQILQLSVDGVVAPSQDLNSIGFLAAEILLQIVDDDAFAQIPTAHGDVLDVVLDLPCGAVLDLYCVVAVQSVGDRPLRVESVQHLVSILHL